MNCVYNNEFAADRKHLKYLFALHILFFSWGCGLCVVSCSKPYQPHEQVTFQNIKCEGAAKNVLPALIAQICLETGATVCLSIPVSVCGDHLPWLRAWSCKQVWQGAASECVTVHQLSPITSWLRGRSCPRPAGAVCRCLCIWLRSDARARARTQWVAAAWLTDGDVQAMVSVAGSI